MSTQTDSGSEDLEEELQHASSMSQEGDASSGYDNNVNVQRSASSESSVRIEIRDVGSEGSSNFTTSTLRKCKKQVLRPYWNLLIFIGWRGFNKESIFAHSLRWRVLNVVYTSIVVGLLLYSYSYEVLACEWKLEAKHALSPLVPSFRVVTTPGPGSVENTTVFLAEITDKQDPEQGKRSFLPWQRRKNRRINKDPGHNEHRKNESGQKEKNVGFGGRHLIPDENPACDHIVTTYLIPGILHFLAYIIGFYYFRVQENEQLDALMEKVFLQATTQQARTASQQKMVGTQRRFLIFGGLWVFASGLLQCLYMWAFDFPTMPLFNKIHMSIELILFSLEIVGRTVFNSVILAIMMNFVIQCEMIKFYVKGLVMRLQEKSTDLKTAMKDVLMLRQSLTQLNGIISRMTSLAGVILAELTVIGVFLLLVNTVSDPKMWAYRGLFPVMWAVMLSLPLYQAARVNSICLRIKKASLEMRVFGYKGASLLDLDSFVQFVHNTTLRAKVFHVAVIPSRLIFSCIVAAFVFLVLVQTSKLGPVTLVI